MPRYHVNNTTGEYGICKAEKKDCPLSDASHYDDHEETMYQSEVILAKNLGLTKKTKKSVMPTTNFSYSYPQADRLDRLAETIDSIGLTTTADADSLSDSISTVKRQALYYADAAGYLGFVKHSANKRNKKVYELTESGKSFAEGNEKERDRLLRHALTHDPVISLYREKGENAAIEYIRNKDNSNDETIERKMRSVKVWADKLNSTAPVVQYDSDLSEKQGFTTEKQAKQGDLCMSCFQVKPLTGICPNCDE